MPIKLFRYDTMPFGTYTMAQKVALAVSNIEF